MLEGKITVCKNIVMADGRNNKPQYSIKAEKLQCKLTTNSKGIANKGEWIKDLKQQNKVVSSSFLHQEGFLFPSANYLLLLNLEK